MFFPLSSSTIGLLVPKRLSPKISDDSSDVRSGLPRIFCLMASSETSISSSSDENILGAVLFCGGSEETQEFDKDVDEDDDEEEDEDDDDFSELSEAEWPSEK